MRMLAVFSCLQRVVYVVQTVTADGILVLIGWLAMLWLGLEKLISSFHWCGRVTRDEL